MQDFMELCRSRQSCRNFEQKTIEQDKLIRCVEAARLAPSGCNAQPWSFVVVQHPDALAEVAASTQQLGLNEFTNQAGAFIVVIEEQARLAAALRPVLDSQYFAKGDLGTATFCLTMEAAEQGLASCIIGVFDRERIAKALEIPSHKQIASVVAVGYPKDPAIRQKKRKPIEQLLRFV